MSKVVDMTNQKYGLLTVISRGDNDKHGKAQWWCQCECGSPLKLISGAALRRGLVISCGCNKQKKLKEYNDTKVVDETGNIYGYLTVLHRVKTDEDKDGRAQWLCRCKCGKEIITTGKLLRDGHKLSCGCMKKSKGEIAIEQLLENNLFLYSEQYTVYIEQTEYEVTQRHPYYFDFAIFKDNKELDYLIEFDGQQHFEGWGKLTPIEKIQEHDKYKNQWCKDNNIPLIRIPYWHLQDLCIADLKLETSKFII